MYCRQTHRLKWIIFIVSAIGGFLAMIDSNAINVALYVIAKDANEQAVIMGDNEMLFSSEVKVEKFNLIYGDFNSENITAKHRYGQVDVPAELILTADGGATIRFKMPQRAVTPGQFVVVYDGETVVGGGEIL